MEDEIVLRIRDTGPKYVFANQVASIMGVNFEDYFLKCIEQGYQALSSDILDDLELPKWLGDGPKEE